MRGTLALSDHGSASQSRSVRTQPTSLWITGAMCMHQCWWIHVENTCYPIIQSHEPMLYQQLICQYFSLQYLRVSRLPERLLEASNCWTHMHHHSRKQQLWYPVRSWPEQGMGSCHKQGPLPRGKIEYSLHTQHVRQAQTCLWYTDYSQCIGKVQRLYNL